MGSKEGISQEPARIVICHEKKYGQVASTTFAIGIKSETCI